VIIPFSASDFLDRALAVYADRTGIVDEPDQPAPSLGDLTYRRVGELARAMAARLDALGIGEGERVAIVSHNSARLMTAFFGVSGFGRVLVPINFRLAPDEVSYIVEHSGARVLYVDPELEDALKSVECEHRFVLGHDDDLYLEGVEPKAWEPDENATATINYTSGTTARPKGVQITHRNIWVNAVTFALHSGVTDRDVYLHTLPMFHANGWGMPFAMTGMGVPQVVLRKVDGAEILRRVAKYGVTVMCTAPAVVAAVLEAAQTWDGEIPGRDRVRIIVAGAPPPTKTIVRVQEELGWEFIQIYGLTETSPLLTINRARQEWDDLDPLEKATRLTRAGAPPPTKTVVRVQEELGWEFIQIYGLTETSPLLTINRTRAEWDDLSPAERATKLSRAGVPAVGIDVRVDGQGEVLAQGNHILKSYWAQPDATADALEGGWFHTGDGGTLDEGGYLTISDRKKDVIISGGENVTSIEVEDALFSHPAVAEVAVRASSSRNSTEVGAL
jgi:acyl-CoA synthetase (AMP-forming)/AMP-acid ligase II